MTDLDTVGLLDPRRDVAETGAGVPHLTHIGKSALFRLILDQDAILAHPPSEWAVTGKPRASSVIRPFSCSVCQDRICAKESEGGVS